MSEMNDAEAKQIRESRSARLRAAETSLEQSIQYLAQARVGAEPVAARALSVAITEAETALLWLRSVT